MQQQCDMIEMTDLHEHNPTDSALIVLSCGHAFTIGTLDHVIGIDRGYTSTVNENTGLKEFVGLRDVTAIKEIPQFPKCLTCKAL